MKNKSKARKVFDTIKKELENPATNIKSFKDFGEAFENIKRTTKDALEEYQPARFRIYPDGTRRRLQKKRIPTRFNAKKLKEKHFYLWHNIESAVYHDAILQTKLCNSENKKNQNIAYNAAFTAIVEMIKRGLL